MNSMTGYGLAASSGADYSLSLEIKSYNNRYLDIFVNLPASISPLEQLVRERVSAVARRGKVEVSIRFKHKSAGSAFVLDRELAKRAYGEFCSLAQDMGILDILPFSSILGIDGLVSTEKEADIDEIRTILEPLLDAALKDFVANREREGAATAADIEGHLAIIDAQAAAVRERVPALEERFKQSLRERFEEIVGRVDEERVMAETAVLLVKTSISEELARLDAHLSDFRREMKENPAPGKKLDFLCQELNREINTTGSKSPDIDTARAVIAMKDALENIREQLRNIE